MWDTKLRGEGQVRAALEDVLLAQRGALIGWVPVCLGIGIGVYFGLGREPDTLIFVWLGIAIVGLAVVARLIHVAYAPLVLGILLILAGVGLAKWQTDTAAAPVLGFRYYGAIEGRIINIDRSASDATRLTLDQVILARMAPNRTPARVRVSVHGTQIYDSFTPGDVIILTGHLSPPSGPAEPGGFDFQRHAWFLQLGAVGYTRTPVLRLDAPSQSDLGVRVFKIRMAISNAVQTAMPGEAGAFAAAVMTGDRSGMGQDTLANLRASNLAHLLAISGLHMGLLTGFVFAVVRYGLALVPQVALRWNTKKIAALCGLLVGAFYLALSGGNVATERAFIMVGVMLIAVLLNRRAVTLRAVAIAAIIVLIWQPAALIGPGFQMSFAATTSLVIVFGVLRKYDLTRLPRWTRPILSVVLSSFVAGMATAPFAAAHFNQFSHYGLIANLLSVPLMGVLVMPAAVLAVCLVPFGLWEVGLWFMELGLRWILWVAQTVAVQDGALSHILAPDWRVLPVLSLGLLWLFLVQGRVRFAGLAAVVLAGAMWQQTERPALLVADDGALVGLMASEGRVLSKSSGSGFVADIWLENDGNPVAQAVAAEREGLDLRARWAMAQLGNWQIVQVSGKTALAAVDGCDGADILISNQVDEVTRPCLVYDLARLRDTGALALDLSANGDLAITTAHGVAGARPWNLNQGPVIPTRTLALSQRKRAAEATLLSENNAAQ